MTDIVKETAKRGFPWRGLIIGLVLLPINVYWVIIAELRWYYILTLNPLFVTPIFYLFLLAIGNGIIKKVAPRSYLRPDELIVIYVMLVMSCAVATHDFIINLMSMMPWPAWNAARWEDSMFPHLPKWLLVWDTNALKGYFTGNANLYSPAVLKAWLAPLAFWSVFIINMGWMMLCLSVILRKAWMEDTKLSYPIVRLPLTLTDQTIEGKTKIPMLLWVGFAVAAGIGIINGLHTWFPDIPEIPVRAQFLQFTQRPWTALTAGSQFTISFYPFGIGLAFLVPLDISFSCWFFYLFFKMQRLIGTQVGLDSIPDYPYEMEQAIGAWLAFGISLIFLMRKHLVQVYRSAMSGKQPEDVEEPMSYRWAFFGFLFGFLIFAAFWFAAGMSIMWAVGVTVVFTIVSICIGRIRAEAGGQHNVWHLEPMRLMRLFNSESLGPNNLSAAALSHWYWRLNRDHPLPSQLEAFKIAKDRGMKMKYLIAPIMIAIVLATIVGMWACLHIFYADGALAKVQGFAMWTNVESWDWLDRSLEPGFTSEPVRWFVSAGAAAFTVVLAWMRTMFVGFPFHPLGYCIAPELRWFWCPFLVAWAIKLVILKYGGLQLYNRAIPFFLGLVLGDYTIGAIWSLVAWWFEVPTYQIFH